jgi:hypothetical protein
MKSSKSNTKIPVATKFSLRHPRYDISANVHSLSEQLFGFTMHYNGHRESAYVMVNRSNPLRGEAIEYVSCFWRIIRLELILDISKTAALR